MKHRPIASSLLSLGLAACGVESPLAVSTLPPPTITPVAGTPITPLGTGVFEGRGGLSAALRDDAASGGLGEVTGPLGLPDASFVIPIVVEDARGRPVAHARVRVIQGEATIFEGFTGSDGRAPFLPALDGFGCAGVEVEVEIDGERTRVEPQGFEEWRVRLPRELERARALDVAIVLDGRIDEVLAADLAHAAERFAGEDVRFAIVRGNPRCSVGSDFGVDLAAELEGSIGEPSEYSSGPAVILALNRLPWGEGRGRVALLLGPIGDDEHTREGYVEQLRESRALGVKLVPVQRAGALGVARWGATITGARTLVLGGEAEVPASLACEALRPLEGLLGGLLDAELSGAPQALEGEAQGHLGECASR